MASLDRILIVGGGIAGLTLATALRQQGYTPEIVAATEASAKFGPHKQASLPPIPFAAYAPPRPPEVVTAAFHFAAEHPEVREVDVNPIFVSQVGTAAAQQKDAGDDRGAGGDERGAGTESAEVAGGPDPDNPGRRSVTAHAPGAGPAGEAAFSISKVDP